MSSIQQPFTGKEEFTAECAEKVQRGEWFEEGHKSLGYHTLSIRISSVADANPLRFIRD